MTIIQRLRNDSPADLSVDAIQDASTPSEYKLPQLKVNVKAKALRSRPRQKQRPPQHPPSAPQHSPSTTTDDSSNGNSDMKTPAHPLVDPIAARHLEKAYELVRFLIVTTGLLLLVRIALAIPWAILMYTAGFVDLLSWQRFQLDALWLASPIVIDTAVVIVLIHSVLNNYRPFRKSIKAVLHVGTFIVLAGAVYGFISVAVNDRASLFSLQSEAVESYNRGFCKVWCRQGDPTLAAFARGQCGQGGRTVFDLFVSFYDISDWCKEAITQQNYALGANYSGVSPFARWNGVGSEEFVTHMRCVVLFHTMFCITFHWLMYTAVDNLAQ